MSQNKSADSTISYSKIVERYAHFFDRPEVRLRFLNNTLARLASSRGKADAALARFKYIKLIKNTGLYEKLLSAWLYHLIFQEIGKLPRTATEGRRQILSLRSRAPLSARIFFRCYEYRHAAYCVAVVLLAASAYGLFTGAVWTARQANSYLASRYRGEERAARADALTNPLFAEAQARHLPDYKPGKVWPVEENDGHERYSNGARILRDYETGSRARGYYVFRGGRPAVEAGLRREPAGIVYHTSESDMLPFTPDNSASIESRSRGLLEYVRRHKSYNYVIDRFGQIYRIVRDVDAANHAGNSVWADARGTYVGLNESFIGVCFESSMEAGTTEERLTEAQLVAGRLLTQILRSRHQIDDANCVTHGLVSVNPLNMLICFHSDWARGFPFEALGLSDKYRVAPASVSEFGFTYDGEVVRKLGGALWPGVAAAEGAFRRRAAESQTRVEELRRQMGEAYRQQLEAQRRAREAPKGDAGAGAAPAAGRPPTPDTPRAGAST